MERRHLGTGPQRGRRRRMGCALLDLEFTWLAIKIGLKDLPPPLLLQPPLCHRGRRAVRHLHRARPTKFVPAVMAAWQMLFALVPLLLVSFWTEGNPLHFPLDATRDRLPALPRPHRFRTGVSLVLLALKQGRGDQRPHDRAAHPAAGGRLRLARCGRDAFALVIVRRGARPARRRARFVEKRAPGGTARVGWRISVKV